MLFSSTNFGEQYFLFDDYYIPLYRYVKENFSTNAFLIDLSVCSYGTYIGNVFFYVPLHCLHGIYVEKTIVYVPFFSHDGM